MATSLGVLTLDETFFLACTFISYCRKIRYKKVYIVVVMMLYLKADHVFEVVVC